jgi:hypothetical protein
MECNAVKPQSAETSQRRRERRRLESNQRVKVLQTFALPLGYAALNCGFKPSLSLP